MNPYSCQHRFATTRSPPNDRSFRVLKVGAVMRPESSSREKELREWGCRTEGPFYNQANSWATVKVVHKSRWPASRQGRGYLSAL